MLLKGRNFQAAPEGSHAAVCVDFVDLGLQKVEWKGVTKMRQKCRIVFEIDALMSDGRRFVIASTFTSTLDPKGRLLPFLTSWRGKKFTAQELDGFESEALVGVPALVQIVHNETNNGVFANIDSIMYPPKGTKRLEPSGEYIRVKDRPDTDKPVAAPQKYHGDDQSGPIEDDTDDLPF
jgi:hypothetical protein